MSKLKQLLATLGVALTLAGCSTGLEESYVSHTESLPTATDSVVQATQEESSSVVNVESSPLDTANYTFIEVDGGNTKGHREPLVVTNTGFGDREYFAYTNEYGQLVRVTADVIILQDDDNEPVKSNGRYYNNMADVPGTEQSNLDKGHVIADSLGGVSNAYNITPQESTLNRHGNQAYMEKTIRDAGGATHFEAIITYPNTTTQIPSHYQYTYTVNGHEVVDSFDNLNPDELNKALGLTGNSETEKVESTPENKEEATQVPTNQPESNSGEYVDENGNGLIKGSSSGIYHTPGSSYYDRTTNPSALFKTVQEAEEAGYHAPKR